MATETFKNLSLAKQQKIEQALLKEFSVYPLATAQVARIVKDAGIARGAFYKYFTDLKDAYQYLYMQAMIEIHQDLPKTTRGQLDLAAYFKQTQDFVATVYQSKYYELIQRHMQSNEGNLPVPPYQDMPAIKWLLMTLSHQAIKECLTYPDHQADILARLKQALAELDLKEGE